MNRKTLAIESVTITPHIFSSRHDIVRVYLVEGRRFEATGAGTPTETDVRAAFTADMVNGNSNDWMEV